MYINVYIFQFQSHSLQACIAICLVDFTIKIMFRYLNIAINHWAKPPKTIC